MKKVSLRRLLHICAALGSMNGLMGAAAPSTAEIETVITQAAAYEPGKSLEAFRLLEGWVGQAAAEPERRKETEKALIRLLQPNASFEAQRFACKQLGIIGSESALPALATMLHDEKTVGIACLALTTYPKGAADETLRVALGSAKGKPRLQIINTMGDRRDAKAVALLTGFARDAELATSIAAISAIGKIGSGSAWEALASLHRKAGVSDSVAVAAAVITCADQLAASGDQKLARTIYTQLLDSSEPAYVRRSAFFGLLRLDKDSGEARILQTLQGSDAALRPAAIAAVREVRAKDASRHFGQALGGLPPAEQVWMIESLAVRADASAREAIGRSLKSGDTDVRLAAIAALGRTGSATEVALLAQAAVTASNLELKAIESALIQLRGATETDEAILAQIKPSSGRAKVCLVTALASRRAAGAAQVLLNETASKDPAVAKAAFRALGKTASGDEVTMLLARLNQPLDSSVRGEAESAAAAALGRIDDVTRRSAMVRTALDRISTREARISLVSLLPGCADGDALATAKAAMADPNAEIRAAALAALGDWPDLSAWETLVETYRTPENEIARGTALRGLARLAEEATGQSGGQVLERYSQLLSGTKGDADLKLILGSLGGVARPEALQLVFPLLTNSAVRPEAEVAVRKIAESIKREHPEVAKDALTRLDQR